jgi:hypothetical protein
MSQGLRSAEIRKNEDGAITDVRLVFGPHLLVEHERSPRKRCSRLACRS